MTFGITPSGFVPLTLPEIKQALEDALTAQFGDINLDPQSIFGQLIGVYSKALADVWENLEAVYYSQYPGSAEGVSLDNVVSLNGITRLPAQKTQVTIEAGGLEGTIIPSNAQVRIPTTGQIFSTPLGGTITRSNAIETVIQVDSVTTEAYTVLVNNVTFTYSLPTIEFTDSPPFVTGNSIIVRLNGDTLPTVNYAVSSAATLTNLASAISSHPDVQSAIVSGETIEITAISGSSVTINSITVTGGATQTGYSISYRAPADEDEITSGLTAVINNGSQPVTATDNSNTTFTVRADDSDISFSENNSTNLSVISRTSPIIFFAQNTGPIPAPANSVTEILTPIGGWQTANNPKAGNTGRDIETDSELRLRRQQSIRILGAATLEAIRARLLQEVAGVTSVFVFENVEMIQEEIQVVFSLPLVSGNVVTVQVNGRSPANINFVTNNLTTMNLVASYLKTQPEISDAVVGGTGNQTITITPKIFQFIDLTTTDFTVTGGAQQAVVTTSGGRPPKSFEAVVEGGTDLDIANKIWQTKPAGIQTYGNTAVTITDSQGDSHVIYFSRATPVYIWVTVQLFLYPSETFPANGQELVAQAILDYGNSLGIGTDVLLQRVLAQIFQVPGISGGDMEIAATNLETDTPVFGTADITIAETQVALFSLDRITVTV